MLRNHVKPNERTRKERKYNFRLGTTAFTKETVRKFVVNEVVVPTGIVGGDAMDTS